MANSNSGAMPPLHIQNYIANCTPAQINQLLVSVQGEENRRAQATSATLSNATATLSSGTSNSTGAQSLSQKKAQKQRSKSGSSPSEPVKAKRPLNSWMAYRAYYARIFPSLQQKEISGFLRVLWDSDQYHAKWSILAKAYSQVRDQYGKEAAPLEKFLGIACPHIGLIKPEDYLLVLGWRIEQGNGQRELVRVFDCDQDLRNQGVGTTNISADDIASNVLGQDFLIIENLLQSDPPSSSASAPSLAMAAQPANHQLLTATETPAATMPQQPDAQPSQAQAAANMDIFASAANNDHHAANITPAPNQTFGTLSHLAFEHPSIVFGAPNQPRAATWVPAGPTRELLRHDARTAHLIPTIQQQPSYNLPAHDNFAQGNFPNAQHEYITQAKAMWGDDSNFYNDHFNPDDFGTGYGALFDPFSNEYEPVDMLPQKDMAAFATEYDNLTHVAEQWNNANPRP